MKKRLQALLLAVCLAVGILFAGCDYQVGNTANEELHIIDDKYRTYYEVFLYSYYDSDGDGIGDIQGLIQKLDYINDGDDSTDTDLGCNGIWLMPIMPSTTYHKYDVTDYKEIDPEYGTLEDFEELMAACHERGINVIIDFVMNHTSSKHPWFKQACAYIESLDGAEPSEEDCPYFGYYNFTKEKNSGSYYQVGETEWYYEAPFWSEMPDLNLRNEAVRAEFGEIADFWLDLGADGFRLDAAKEYFSDLTDSNVEVLTWFNDMVKSKKEDAYIVAEVWSDLDTYAKYYASGIDSCFDFSFASTDGIIANTVKKISGASSYGKKLVSLQEVLSQYNENYIDAPFYTNHDLGRSAGYYAGDNSESQTKIAGAMNLMMSGAAFVYYGEEIGMKGAGKDENKRAPMQWSASADADGMCDGPADMDEVKMKYGSLEEQQESPASIYNYYKKAIKLRNIYPSIARGTVTFLEDLSDEDICAITKEYEEETITIIFNISENEKTVNVADDLKLSNMLLVGEEEAVLEKGALTLPAYSIAIFQ